MKNPKIKTLAAATMALLLASGAVPAQAASEVSCESFVTNQIQIQLSSDLVASACEGYKAEIARSAIPEVPTLLMAWPAVGITNDAGQVGPPVSGVCILGGAIAGVNRVQYVLAGSGQSLGPATSTRIACTAGPLATDSTLIGPAAATATTELADLQAMSVCTLVVGEFLLTGPTRSKTPAGCSLKPSANVPLP
jgi:hypothetical protein